MVSIQILSDLHLEWYARYAPHSGAYNKTFDFPKTANHLGIIGDLAYPDSDLYKDFVYAQADRYKLVFIIAGNQPYW